MFKEGAGDRGGLNTSDLPLQPSDLSQISQIIRYIITLKIYFK